MQNINSKFKKYEGTKIPDIVQYLREYIEKNPTVTISVGCDSIQRRRKTVYAVTIMMYDTDIRNGAHVVFFRESHLKIRDNHERLHKEAEYVHDIGTYLHDELSTFYTRKDLTNIERQKYKYHLAKCNGEYAYVMPHQEGNVIEHMPLVPADMCDYKLVDLHVDFNPFEGSVDGVSKNKSYVAYKSYVPWLRGLGFRVFAKPLGFSSTSAADLLLHY